MSPDGAIEPVDSVFGADVFDLLRSSHVTGQISFDLIAWKKVSAIALSQQFSRPLIEIRMPRLRNSA